MNVIRCEVVAHGRHAWQHWRGPSPRHVDAAKDHRVGWRGTAFNLASILSEAKGNQTNSRATAMETC
jgi:hypothetical protein